MNAQIAWEIFQAADHFGLEELRDVSMSAILIEPKKSLAKRPAVSETLLEEVLASDFLCISHGDLFDLLMMWDEAEEGGLNLHQLIGKYVSTKYMHSEKLNEMTSFIADNEFECLESLHCRWAEHTTDVISLLTKRFDAWARRRNLFDSDLIGYFLSDWVHFRRSLGVSFEMDLFDVASLGNSSLTTRSARSRDLDVWGRSPRSLSPNPWDVWAAAGLSPSGSAVVPSESATVLRKGHWVEWRLPFFDVKLLGVKLLKGTDENTDLKVFCIGERHPDGHEVFSSKEWGAIEAGTVVRCRGSRSVQGFRVSVAEGEFSLWNIRFEGILRERWE